MLVVAALGVLCFAAPARAQNDAQTVSEPLSASADGRGALQLRMAGSPQDGEFDTKPAPPGLQVASKDFDGDAREPVSGPTLSDDQQSIRSTYRVGGALEVSETVAVQNDDTSRARLTYAIKNVSGKPLSFSAGELAELAAPVDDLAQGVRADGFVGGLDRLGRQVGLEAVTPFSHSQAGPATDVYANFANGTGLDDSASKDFTALAVGAQWDVTDLKADDSTEITVVWRVPRYRWDFDVNTTDDHDDGSCSAADCSLREAVHYAPGSSAIRLIAGTFTLKGSELPVDSAGFLSIAGAGARATTIDGNGASRIFNVRSGELELVSLTLTGGDGEPGGTVPGPFATADAVPAGSGGAIAVQPRGLLSLFNVAISGNTARVGGGGIATEGGVQVFASLIAGNTARTGNGGGVATLRSPDAVTYTHFETSTVSGNHALAGTGGGVYGEAQTSFTYSTVAFNDAKTGGGGVHLADVGDVYFNSSLFAKNTPQSCSGVPQGNTGHDLADDPSCAFAGPGEVLTDDAKLQPLADNGGQTDTHALAPGSPAIKAGDVSTCGAPDQRGVPRAFDDERCDIGAFETPGRALERLGHIAGRPLDVYADGLGELQIRRNDSARGAFADDSGALADAGLAIVQDGVYYPAGGPGVTDATGARSPVSGPNQRITAPGARALESRYYVGSALEVTETVSYQDSQSGVRVSYAIRNASKKPVTFRAAELARVQTAGRATSIPGAVGVTAADGSAVRLQGDGWNAIQVGSAYGAFAHSGLGGDLGGASEDEFGAQYDVALSPGETKTITLRWELADATDEVQVTTEEDSENEDCTKARCTLRAALEKAPAGSVIRVPAGDYGLSNAPIRVDSDRIVHGAGAGATVIRAVGAHRVIDVTGGGLGLSGVRVTGGDARMSDPHGGGIKVGPEATLALADSRVDHNTAQGQGGGLYLQGPTSIVRTTIDSNSATAVDTNGRAFGGTGGGVRAEADLNLVNTTISGNEAELSGGGLDTATLATLVNVTVSANKAPNAAGYSHTVTREGPGRGAVGAFDGPDLTGVIVAGNSGSSECAGDDVLLVSDSLAGDESCGFTSFSTDAGVGGLVDGVHPLLPGSPAIDLMNDPRCATGDQHGTRRPSGARCDAGAYERTASDPPTIDSPSEGQVLGSRQVTLRGRAPADNAVFVSENGKPIATGSADGSGNWVIEVTVDADGVHTFEVTYGESRPALRTVRIDTVAPSQPTLSATVDGTTVTLSGSVFDDSASVELFDGTESLGRAPLTGSEFSQTLTGVQNGRHTYTAVARDEAGNAARSPERVVTVGGAPPEPPLIVAPDEHDLLNTHDVAVSGASAPGATIEVREGTQVQSATANGDGVWQVTLTGLADGQHTFTATASNEYGTSAPSSRTITIDTTPPPVPTLSTATADGSTVTLTGDAPEAVEVEILEGGESRGKVRIDTGPFTIDLRDVADGVHSYTAVASDPAGNRSEPSAPRSVRVGPPAVSQLASSRMDVWMDGIGTLQVGLSGRSDTEFTPAGDWLGRAGLELVVDGVHSPVQGTDRRVVSETDVDSAGQTATSRYRAAGLEVTERVSISDTDDKVRLEYELANPGAAGVTVRAGELAAVAGVSRGWEEDGFVGTRDHRGQRIGLTDATPAWDGKEVGPVATVFDHFRDPGLSGNVAGGFGEQAAGAQWNLSIGAGETRTIKVAWLIDPAGGDLNVTTTDDHDDGFCDVVDCSLREAFSYADDYSVIRLGRGTYRLESELKSSRSGVTLIGRGARATTIDGGRGTRLLNVLEGNVAVRGVTFRGGNGVPNDGIAPFGFARDDASVPSGSGGAIAVQALAALELRSSAIVDSVTTGANSTGGALASAGSVSIDSSLIARNRSVASGGGLAVTGAPDDSAELDVRNSTVTENTAGSNGGGVFAGARTSLYAVTLARNFAGALGGGVYVGADAVTSANTTLLASNQRGAEPAPVAADCGGERLAASQYSLADDDTCQLAGEHDVPPADARIGPLQDNGGPTDTVALLPGSPAIDGSEYCLTYDQRGAVRNNDARCDIGAFETTSVPLEPIGRIAGRPLDIAADGIGRVQVRAGEDPLGAFQMQFPNEVGDGGLAFMVGDTYYPVGGPAGSAKTGKRTWISGPRAGASEPGRRTLRSEYAIGDKLLVTETVSYAEGATNATLNYAIRNISGAPLDFRAAQLASLSRAASGERTGANALVATAANGGKLTLTNESPDPWRAQMGATDGDSDVYAAFTAGELKDTIQAGPDNDQLGAEWSYQQVPADATRTIQVSWTVDAPPPTYTVNSTADEDDGACEAAPDGDCTLREALAAPGEHKVVQLPGETFELQHQLVVTHHTIIRGAGARSTILKGVGGERVLDVEAPASLGLSGVTVMGGTAAGTGSGNEGGFSQISDGGGGIRVNSAALALADSTIKDNTASYGGGILVFGGTLSIVRSTISGNRAVRTSPEAGDGAFAGVFGLFAAIYSANSTVSGNTADGIGGGLGALGVGRLLNTTITGNRATAYSGLFLAGFGDSGEGSLPDVFGWIDVRGSIVAGNEGSAQCYPASLRSSYNIAGDSSCGFTGEGDREIADPKLGPLADNGGPTDTHLPLPGSPAIDGGGNQRCATGDQRGIITRPFGGQCDVGSVEVGELPPAPDPPVITSPGQDTAVNTTSIPLQGTAAPGTTIEVRENGELRGTTETNQNGSWVVVANVSGEGEHTFTLIARAGGVSSSSVLRTVIVDTIPPPVPLLTAAATKATVSLSGSAAEAVSVELFDGDTSVGKPQLSGGNYALNLTTVSDGEHVYKAVARDAAGNRAESAPQKVTVDGTPPPVPTLTATPAGGTSITLSGTAGGDAVGVSFWEGGQRVGGATVTAGQFSFTVSVLPGTHRYTARAFDAADNVSDESEPATIKVGTPEAPTLDSAIAEGSKVTLTGRTGERTAKLEFFQDGQPLGKMDSGANVAFTHALAHVDDGTHTYYAVAYDADGTASERSATKSVTVDTKAPPPPSLAATRSGVSEATLAGEADSSATKVRLLEAGTSVGTADVVNGKYTLATDVSPGIHTYTARAVDAAGNESPDSVPATVGAGAPELDVPTVAGSTATVTGRAGARTASIKFFLENGGVFVGETSASPNAPFTVTREQIPPGTYDFYAIAYDADGFESAHSTTRTVKVDAPPPPAPKLEVAVNGSSVTLSGSASGAVAVELFEGSASLGSVAVDQDGAFSKVLDGVKDGEHTYHAVARDAAGNVSEPSTDHTAVVDAQPPGAPTLQASVTGSTVTLSGVASGATAVEILEGTKVVGSTAPAASGAFSFTLERVDDGPHTYTAVSRDGGGRSAPSPARTVTVDTQPPPAPAVAAGDSDQPSAFTLSGQAEPGAEVTVYEGERALQVTTAGADGAWSVQLAGVAPGQHTYSAVARDAAGNVSARSASRTVQVAQPQQQTPTPTPTPSPSPTPTPAPTTTPPPPPQTGQSVNVEVKSGKVLLKVPGSNRFVELGPGQQIPVGTTVDTTKGRVTLTSAGAGGKLETADFYDGIFKISQTGGKNPITVLTLTEPLSCPRGRASAAANKKTRKLWGSGKGAFRTNGSYSSATVRGTTWLTQDTCTTTLTRVTQGVVAIRDRVKNKTIVLRAPKSYTARARRR